MKLLIRLHRTLSCFVAPAMIFFAVSGAWQAFRLQESSKDGSYKAPVALERLSEVHKAERLTPAGRTFFRVSQLALAVIFIVTAVAGIVMGLRVTRPVWVVWVLLLAGTGLPALAAALAHR